MEDKANSKVKDWLKELPKEFNDESASSSAYLSDETTQSQEKSPSVENW